MQKLIRRLAIPAVIAAIAAVTLSGYGSSSSASPQNQPESSKLPIDAAINMDHQRTLVLNEAQNKIISACMKRKGFDYLGANNSVDEMPQQKRFGFENRAEVEEALSTSENAGPVEQLPADPAAYGNALAGTESDRMTVKLPDGSEVGIPSAGCRAEASAAVRGDVEAIRNQQLLLNTLRTADHESFENATKDAEMVALTQQWRECMKQKGFRETATPAVIEASETDRVNADLECKESTDFVTKAYEILGKYQQDAVDANAGVIEQWNKFWDDSHDRAKRLLLSNRDASS